jgi:hypothetical protein
MKIQVLCTFEFKDGQDMTHLTEKDIREMLQNALGNWIGDNDRPSCQMDHERVVLDAFQD